MLSFSPRDSIPSCICPLLSWRWASVVISDSSGLVLKDSSSPPGWPWFSGLPQISVSWPHVFWPGELSCPPWLRAEFPRPPCLSGVSGYFPKRLKELELEFLCPIPWLDELELRSGSSSWFPDPGAFCLGTRGGLVAGGKGILRSSLWDLVEIGIQLQRV